MPKIIPNQNSYIGFTTVAPAGYTAANINANSVSVTSTELAAATNITPFVVQIDASQAGNMIPTPALDSLFERQIIGTTQGTLSATFYRDNTADTAWNAMSKGTIGYFLISRFGGTNADKSPAAGQTVEVWPITVAQRKASAMTSNTVQTFDVMGALDVPVENAGVVSVAGVPSLILLGNAYKEANGIAILDWTAPAFLGAGGLNATTPYKVYQTTAGGAAAQVASGASATATGTSGQSTILTSAIASGTIAVGQIVSGTGIGTNAVVTAISGTSPALTVTLSVANASAVSGTIVFGSTALTSSVTVSGTTARISSGLTTGQAYYFAVEAVNAAGTSGARAVVGPVTV
jgi:hypothetical protein